MVLRRSLIRQCLERTDPAAQVRFWRAHLDTARFRAALAVAINPLALRAIYSSALVPVLPKRFDRIIRGRLARYWARHPNRSNPYAWRVFIGAHPPDCPVPTIAAD